MNIELYEANKCFIETIKKGSIKQAGEALNLNPNTVRKKIKALEEYLEITLLNSNNKGQSPTDEGWEYYDSISTSMNNIELDMQSFKTNKSFSSRKITYKICVPVLGSIILSKYVMKDLVEKFPEYLFEMKSFSYSYAQSYGAFYRDMIKDSNFLVLDSSYLGLIHPDEWNMSFRHTIQKFKLYASKAYLSKTDPIQTIQDLKGHRFVTRIAEGHENGVVKLYNNQQKRSMTVNLNVVGVVGIESIKIEQLQSGVGIGILDPYLAEGAGLIEILPEYYVNSLYDVVILTKPNHREVTGFIVQKLRETFS